MRLELGDTDFCRLLEYVRARTGMCLPETNYRETEGFVLERLEALGCPFPDYLERLDADTTEARAFVNVVAISETYFFREEKHFSLLCARILPVLAGSGRSPVRMWSAACSTGEEPLSLYLIGRETLGAVDRFVVYASDLNESALSAFAEGRYSANSLRTDGLRYHGLVQAVAATDGGKIVIPPQLISRIPKAAVNLDRLCRSPFGTPFDVILLRNVLIYFGREERERIVDRVAGLLTEGGVLFLSSAEIPLVGNRQLEVLEEDGVFFLRRKTADKKRPANAIDASLATDVKREERAVRARVPERRTADFVRAISYVNAKINNHQFAVADDPSYELALRLIEILYQVNTQDFDRAQPALRNLEREAGRHEVISCLDGYMLMARSNTAAAICEFGRAVAENPHCWPARYWRAVLLARDGDARRAHKEFGRCIADIDAYIAAESYAYEFLLEGFNGKYFRRICENWLEKTSRKTQ